LLAAKIRFHRFYPQGYQEWRLGYWWQRQMMMKERPPCRLFVAWVRLQNSYGILAFKFECGSFSPNSGEEP
jgi:hypothetical protein